MIKKDFDFYQPIFAKLGDLPDDICPLFCDMCPGIWFCDKPKVFKEDFLKGNPLFYGKDS